MEINLKIKQLNDDAVMPFYANKGDVGMDLTAISAEYDADKDLYIYHTGIAVESEENYGLFLFPRSSNRKTDAYLCNSVGIVDSATYRGEILLCFKNRDSIQSIAENKANEAMMEYFLTTNVESNQTHLLLRKGFEIYNETKNAVLNDAKLFKYAPYKVGDKVAQMVLMPHPTVNINLVSNLSETARGANGFGSSGN